MERETEKKKTGKETERQTKVQVKVQGHLSSRLLITRRSQRTLKRQGKGGKNGEKKAKKRDRNNKKKSNYIQLISEQSQNKMKQCVERTWLRTKPSNQPERKTARCFIKPGTGCSIK